MMDMPARRMLPFPRADGALDQIQSSGGRLESVEHKCIRCARNANDDAAVDGRRAPPTSTAYQDRCSSSRMAACRCSCYASLLPGCKRLDKPSLPHAGLPIWHRAPRALTWAMVRCEGANRGRLQDASGGEGRKFRAGRACGGGGNGW